MGESGESRIKDNFALTLEDCSKDCKISKARTHFYTVLMNKRRNIRRIFLNMNALANEHLLETLSFRAMLERNVDTAPVSSVDDNDEHLINDLKSSKVERPTLETESAWDDPDIEAENDLEIRRLLGEESAQDISLSTNS